MDTATRNAIITKTLQKERYRSTREKLRKLLVERQVPFLSSINDMEVQKTIGCGAFGIVELVRYQKKLYAHKRPLHDTPPQRITLLEEAIKLTDIDEYHPNVQRLCFINLKSYGFLMDYCCCGSLDKIVTDNNLQYTLVDVLNWGYQLADALSFLHSKNIMHRDVKTQNILLKDNYQTLVLTDYGTATQLGRSLLTQEVGTPVTMAPEVFNGTKYAEQCDIYSWSIVLWQLLSKDLFPYGTQNKLFLLKIVTENLRPPQLNNCPKLLNALMYRSWHSNPNERPTLLCIKKILRLMLNNLPEKRHDYSQEMIIEVKNQWINDSNSLEKYLPSEPLLNNEKSKNIYQDHLKKMAHILNMKKNIFDLEQQFLQYSKQNQLKHDHYKQLLEENQNLQKEIKKLREKKLH